jgi:FKBP-type peptidyl-prolyl cis-trans isomerase FkpA
VTEPTGPGLPQNPEDVTFAAALGIDLAVMTKLPSGVYIQTLNTSGVGTPMTATDRFTADYQGWTTDGDRFDSGTLPNFRLDQLIAGFASMVGMTVGETRLLVIPSELGYGSAGYAVIPPNAVLVFEVILRAINP